MPNRGKNYGNASQVTTHIDDYGGMKYADGGSVRKQNKVTGTAKKFAGGGMAKGYADGGKVAKKKKKKKAKPEMLGTGAAAAAGRAVSGRQRQIDKALEDAGA